MASGIKLKRADVAKARKILQAQNGNKCPLCGCDFTTMTMKGRKRVPKYTSVLDHCHQSGYVRDALCRNCNGMEGRIYNRANTCKRDGTVLDWVKRLVAYWDKHSTPQTQYIHPDHKSDDEKRLKRNADARKRRANAKAAAILKARKQ